MGFGWSEPLLESPTPSRPRLPPFWCLGRTHAEQYAPSGDVCVLQTSALDRRPFCGGATSGSFRRSLGSWPRQQLVTETGQGLTQKAPHPILVSHDEDRLTTDSVNAVPDRDSFLGRWFAQMRLVGRPRTRILLPLRFRRGPDHRSESPFRTPRPARIPFPCPNPWS